MRLMRDLHKYFGLVTALVVILVSATGILLVHRKSLGLSKVSLSLPGYAAPTVPDAWDIVTAPDGSTLVTTRQGIYRRSGGGWEQVLNSPTRQFVPADGLLYAAARDGVFASGDGGRSWQPVLQGEVKALLNSAEGLIAATTASIYRQVPGKLEEWQTLHAFGAKPLDVRKLLSAADGLQLAAKEGVFTLAGGRLQPLPLPPAAAGPQKVELQKIVTDLHTGDFFGRWFFLVVDLTAAGMILLTLTGVYLWWWSRQRRRAVLKNGGTS
jgi:hypothetical protein